MLAGALLPAQAQQRVLSKDKRSEIAAATTPKRPAGPLQIVVSIGSQRLMVYDKDQLVATSIISTGVGGFPTPTGVFSVLDKEVTHYSNIYGGASMPFMQRLTMSGVALHSGMVTGRPASHGCIRLPHAFSIRLFAMTKLGTRVMIAPNEAGPVEIEHAGLFQYKPMPPATETEALTEQANVAKASALEAMQAAAEARKGPGTLEREAALRAQPISVFVSKAEGKVFVRQGFMPLLDAPAVVREPEHALGTHIYTALEPKDDGARMRWTVVSLLGETRGQADARAGARRLGRGAGHEELEPAPASRRPPSNAAEALDRIALPPDAIDQISALLSPGASLIISDHGFNREMRAKGTDFIVLTK